MKMIHRTESMNESNNTIHNNESHAEIRWYVMRVINRKEFKAKEYIDTMLNTNDNFADHVSQVYVPTEDVETMRKGRVIVTRKCRFAGYIYVEAELVGNIQSKLEKVPNVLGFLTYSKTSRTPMPLSTEEVTDLLAD